MASKVFIIEDDADIRDSLSELFEVEGYEVSSAANGQEALDKLAANSSSLPDVILLDLMMPVKDGFEFRRAQLQVPQWEKIPVIVMSADANVRQKLEAAGGPIPPYLKKPVNLDDILNLVAKTVGKAS